jgi:AcrR family transcriptional regulator
VFDGVFHATAKPRAVVRARTGRRSRDRSASVVAVAARWIYEGRRLDMQGLADELGVSRVTLFRRIGSREELLSRALRLLTERTLEAAVARWEAERPAGELHTPGTGRYINAIVSQATGLRRLLDDEPALALRVLTDPRGRVQTLMVAFLEELLHRDIEEFGLVTLIEPGALAYALVRLGESFLYADVLAARKPDVETAVFLQQALFEASCRRTDRDTTARSEIKDLSPERAVVPAAVIVPAGQAEELSLAISASTIASCSSSSRLASRVRHRPFSSGMENRKKMMPPKQIQYHVFHCPAVWAAALLTAAPWACR